MGEVMEACGSYEEWLPHSDNTGADFGVVIPFCFMAVISVMNVMEMEVYKWPGLKAHWRTRDTSPEVTFDQGQVMGGGS